MFSLQTLQIDNITNIVKNFAIFSCNILCALLVLFFVYLMFYSLTPNIDTDVLAEMNFGIQMLRNHSLFPNNWVYANEFMFFRPAFLYACLYYISNDYLLSQSITLLFCFIIFMLSFVYFYKGLNSNYKYLGITILLLVSLSCPGRSFAVLNFLFYGYYCFYTSSILFILGTIERINKSIQLKKIYINIFICLLFTIAFGVIGIRMTLCFFIPLVITTIKPLNLFTHINLSSKKFILLMFLCNCCGFIINKTLLKEELIPYNAISSTSILPFDQTIKHFYDTILEAIFFVIGTRGNFPLVSIITMDMSLKFLLLFTLFIVLFRFLKERKKINPSIQILLNSELILLFIGSVSTFYVHSFYFNLLPVLIAISLSFFLNFASNLKIILFSFLVIFISSTNLYVYYYPLYTNHRNTEDIQNVANYITSKQITNLATTFWDAAPIQSQLNGKIHIAFVNDGIDTPYYWLNTKSNYENCHYLLLRKNIIEKITNNKNSLLNKRKNEQVLSTNDFSLFKFKNPIFNNFDLPKKLGETKKIPIFSLLLLNDAFTDDEENIISSGKEGLFVYGPYIKIYDGTYTFDFNFDIEQCTEKICGKVDITSNSGNNILGVAFIENGMTKSTIDNVKFNNNTNVEFRIWANKNAIIKAKNIEVVLKP